MKRRKRLKVYISKAYFPKEMWPKILFTDAFEFWSVLAHTRQEAADLIWKEHGKRLKELMIKRTSKFGIKAKISLHVSSDSNIASQRKSVGAGRLVPIKVNSE